MNIFEDEIIQTIDIKEFERVFSPGIQSVVNAIRKYGFDLRVVGGAVRDFILGKVPRDVDFVTDADPAELILIFDLEGIEYDAGGIEHGTVKAVFGKEKVDVSSIAYKIDVDDAGRMAITRGNDWEEDALGRDLTINTMSLDMDGKIHDYADGIKDIKDGVIRFTRASYSRIDKHPDLIMRWFKALAYFDNPKWPQEDFELIKNKLPLLAKVRDDSKTAKTLGDIVASPGGRKVIELMCMMGANKFIDLNCS